jgi:hypothetical protein
MVPVPVIPRWDVTGSPTAPQLSQLPGHFEDVVMDDLVVLIGQDCVCSMLDDLLISWFRCSLDATADLLDRIIVLNDQIPLNEYV